MRLITLFFIFMTSFLVSAEMEEVEQFLNTIASAEEKLPEGVNQETLNALSQWVLKSDNLHLIHLFQRAVRNHDSLSSEKAEPVTIFYKHYQSPHFFIPKIDLTFDIDEKVTVTTDLTVKRNSFDSSLILDGRGHKVLEVFINGRWVPREKYKITPHELILLEIPEEDSFYVKIKSEINPFDNHTLEGMYLSGKWLTTQCESEGARRIFFTLDRPDVLSKITTTIIADKEIYPYRLSNGDFVEEVPLKDGRWKITWDDPFPKPSYLFACVLGDFSQLKSHFTTRSGREVELQIYVEKGKESRAPYALYALKKAMEFDEEFFDREYDLSCLKMVGIPDFNSGAMENKGLMIFNDVSLLVDSKSGTDGSFRRVAEVVAHEYFHNWSGNRVTIRNWFEIALKEAFTDFRAMLFEEWLFGSEFIRPKAVLTLMAGQFPEETSEKGHPIIVESYVDAHSIYDGTTYVKGREVFRTFKNYIDTLIPDGFRQVQNLYFSRYDGQAVTFRELLTSANDILKEVGKDVSQFERWFHQQGTPHVNVQMTFDHDKKMAEFTITQSCEHPKTKKAQEPLIIPFSLELLGSDGGQKISSILEEAVTIFKIPCSVKPTPVFMHGYTAPVILEYDYTAQDLACIIQFSDDPFCRWEATQKYSLHAFKEMMQLFDNNSKLEKRAEKGDLVLADLLSLYPEVLKSTQINPLAKAQMLEIPSLRTLAQNLDCYDFERLGKLKFLFSRQLAQVCQPYLEALLEKHPPSKNYEVTTEQMQIRELRNSCFALLAAADKKYHKIIFENYQSANNFNDEMASFILCLDMKKKFKKSVISDFYNKWNQDKAVLNFWFSNQASARECSVKDLLSLESVKGYDAKNPNHIRSICGAFMRNLSRYHHSSGEGYSYIVDKIIEVGKFNPTLTHNYIAVPALVDFEKIPAKQQAMLAKELVRLRNHDQVPAQTRDLVEKILDRYK